MNSQNLFASILLACVLAASQPGVASGANAAWPGHSAFRSGNGAGPPAIRTRHRGHVPRLFLPIAPSYLAYDYPYYYYARGYYPKHIGPGYIHYGNRYFYSSRYYPRFGQQCSNKQRKCVAGWRSYRQSGTSHRQKVRGM